MSSNLTSMGPSPFDLQPADTAISHRLGEQTTDGGIDVTPEDLAMIHDHLTGEIRRAIELAMQEHEWTLNDLEEATLDDVVDPVAVAIDRDDTMTRMVHQFNQTGSYTLDVQRIREEVAVALENIVQQRKQPSMWTNE